MMKPIAIIGVGNFLMGDEGAGIHGIKKLETIELPKNVELIDAGVPSLALLHMIEGREVAIVLDCADFGGKPGELKAFTLDQIKDPAPEKKASLHAADLLSTFNLAQASGIKLPEVWLVGIQPHKVEMSTNLSKEARSAIETLPEVIKSILDKYSSLLH